MSREEMLAKAMVELADTLVADFDVVEPSTVLADRCVEVLDVEAAGIMLVAPDGDLRGYGLIQPRDAGARIVRAAIPGRAVPRLLPHRPASREPGPGQPLAADGPDSPPKRSPPAFIRCRHYRCDCAAS